MDKIEYSFQLEWKFNDIRVWNKMYVIKVNHKPVGPLEDRTVHDVI